MRGTTCARAACAARGRSSCRNMRAAARGTAGAGSQRASGCRARRAGPRRNQAGRSIYRDRRQISEFMERSGSGRSSAFYRGNGTSAPPFHLSGGPLAGESHPRRGNRLVTGRPILRGRSMPVEAGSRLRGISASRRDLKCSSCSLHFHIRLVPISVSWLIPAARITPLQPSNLQCIRAPT